ncbi:MAG: hypothetical protein Q9N62_00955 [Ghiorsea sp.]|nr:hypothetical protein [Ghiorsea sp.]
MSQKGNAAKAFTFGGDEGAEVLKGFRLNDLVRHRDDGEQGLQISINSALATAQQWLISLFSVEKHYVFMSFHSIPKIKIKGCGMSVLSFSWLFYPYKSMR